MNVGIQDYNDYGLQAPEPFGMDECRCCGEWFERDLLHRGRCDHCLEHEKGNCPIFQGREEIEEVDVQKFVAVPYVEKSQAKKDFGGRVEAFLLGMCFATLVIGLLWHLK